MQPRSPDSLPDLGVWAGVHSIRPGSGEMPQLLCLRGRRSGQCRHGSRCLPGNLLGICAGDGRVLGLNSASEWKLKARFPGSADTFLPLSQLGEEPHCLAPFSAEVLSLMFRTGVFESDKANSSLCLLGSWSCHQLCISQCPSSRRASLTVTTREIRCWPRTSRGAHIASRTRAHQGGAAAPS